MSWVKLTAPVKPAAPTGAKLSLTIGKTRSRMNVALPSAQCGAHGWDGFERADVFFGEGENAGLMMIQPHEDGLLKVKRWKTAVIIYVPEQKGWINKAGSLGVAAMTFAGGGRPNACIITLPLGLKAAPSLQRPEAQAVVVQSAAKGQPEGLKLTGTVLSLTGRYANLTTTELIIYQCMARKWGHAARKAEILDALYGDDPNGGADDKTLDVFISKLRKKLASLGLIIITHRDVGYSIALSPGVAA